MADNLPEKENRLGKLQIQWGNPHLCSSCMTKEEQSLRPNLIQKIVESMKNEEQVGITAHLEKVHPSVRTANHLQIWSHWFQNECGPMSSLLPVSKRVCAVHSPTCAYCGSKLLCSLARKFQIFRIQCFVFYAFLSWLRSCEKCCAIVELSDLVPLVTINYRVPWMRKKLLLF